MKDLSKQVVPIYQADLQVALSTPLNDISEQELIVFSKPSEASDYNEYMKIARRITDRVRRAISPNFIRQHIKISKIKYGELSVD